MFFCCHKKFAQGGDKICRKIKTALNMKICGEQKESFQEQIRILGFGKNCRFRAKERGRNADKRGEGKCLILINR